MRTAGRLALVFLLAGATLGEARTAQVGVVPFDSGTRVVREVAEALTGEGRSILESYPRGSEIFLGLVSLLPERARIAAIEWGMRLSLGHDPDRADDVSVDALAAWCVDQYPGDGTRYEAIVVGSPNGAVAHLAALLGAPFLTSSFGLVFDRNAIDPDDLDAYLKTSLLAARRIVAANPTPQFEVVCHYDPIHDRSVAKAADFVRIKLHELPACYRDFIRDRLAPGGSLVLVNCAYAWPQAALDERIFLQVGGLGAVDPADYLARWPADRPAELRRESEWGCPEGFAAAVRDYAESANVDLLEIAFDHPSDYSLLAYDAYLACDGARPDLLLIDSFNHQNARTNLATGIPGLWLPFNTEDGPDLVERAIAGRTFDAVYLAPLPSFARSPDILSLDAWRDLVSPSGPLRLIGVRPDKYPADPLAPYRLARDLRALRDALLLEDPLRLSVGALASLASEVEP